VQTALQGFPQWKQGTWLLMVLFVDEIQREDEDPISSKRGSVLGDLD
jgi:hypothetical protein